MAGLKEEPTVEDILDLIDPENFRIQYFDKPNGWHWQVFYWYREQWELIGKSEDHHPRSSQESAIQTARAWLRAKIAFHDSGLA